jgi:hypothetical protein
VKQHCWHSGFWCPLTTTPENCRNGKENSVPGLSSNLVFQSVSVILLTETFGTIGAITARRKFVGNPYKPSWVHCICNTNACKWGEQSAEQLLKIVTEVRSYCCTMTVEGSREWSLDCESWMEAGWEEQRKATNFSVYVKKTGRTFMTRKSKLLGNCKR